MLSVLGTPEEDSELGVLFLGELSRLKWRLVTAERAGRARSILKVRDDEVCEKTHGSNSWSFQSLYFFSAQPAAWHTAEGQ